MPQDHPTYVKNWLNDHGRAEVNDTWLTDSSHGLLPGGAVNDASPLQAAAQYGRLEILQRLLKAKADPNPALGTPPLVLAATCLCADSYKCVDALLDAGADCGPWPRFGLAAHEHALAVGASDIAARILDWEERKRLRDVEERLDRTRAEARTDELSDAIAQVMHALAESGSDELEALERLGERLGMAADAVAGLKDPPEKTREMVAEAVKVLESLQSLLAVCTYVRTCVRTYKHIHAYMHTYIR